MSTEEATAKRQRHSCPECGHAVRVWPVSHGRMSTGESCLECGVKLYVQYVRNRWALTKRAAFIVWPALLVSIFWVDNIAGWLAQIVSPWLFVATPFLVLAVVFGIAISKYRSKIPFGSILLSTDVGGWSLVKRRLYHNSMFVVFMMYIVWGVLLPAFGFVTSVLSWYDLLILTLLPGYIMMLIGFPYAETMTPKSDAEKEVLKDDGWIPVDSD